MCGGTFVGRGEGEEKCLENAGLGRSVESLEYSSDFDGGHVLFRH